MVYYNVNHHNHNHHEIQLLYLCVQGYEYKRPAQLVG